MLMAYLVSFIALALVYVLTGAALHFAQYKKRGGCCSSGLEGMGNPVHGCKTCKCEKGE